MAQSRFIEKIRNVSLIKMHPSFEELFTEKGKVIFFQAGDTIIKQGVNLEFLYIPIDDNLKLIKEDPEAPDQLVGFLQTGRALLLKNLINNIPTTYAVKTEANGSLLAIPKKDFIEHLSLFEGMKEYLHFMGSNSGVREFKKHLEDLGISIDVIMNIFKFISPKLLRLKANTNYQSSKHIYFCARGKFQLEINNKKYLLNEGAWFGGSLLVNQSIQANILTKNDTYFYRLNVNKIKHLLEPEQIDNLSQEPYLQRFKESYTLHSLSSQPLDLPLSSSEEKFLKSLLDTSVLQIASHKESYFEVLANNYSYLSQISFDMTSFSLLKDSSEVSLGDIAKTFELSGFLAVQKSWQTEKHFLCLYENHLLIHIENYKDHGLFWDSAHGLVSIKKDLIDTILVISEDIFGERDRSLKFFDLRDLIQKFLPDQSKYLQSIIFLTFLITAFDLIIPKISQYLIDDVLPTKDFHSLWVAMGALLICSIFNLTLGSFIGVAISVYAGQVEKGLYPQFYNRILNLSLEKLSKLKIGGILNRIGDLGSIRDFLVQEVFTILESSLKIILSIALLFYYGWQVGLISLVIIPLSLAIRWLYKKRLKEKFDQVFEVNSLSQSFITEIVSSIITVKSSGSEKKFQSTWEQISRESVEKNETAELMGVKVDLASNIVTNLFRVIIIWIAVSLVIEGKLTGGAIVAISMYLNIYLGAVVALSSLITRFENLKVSINKMDDVLEDDGDGIYQADSNHHTILLDGRIRFERVSFRYDENSHWVLNEASFTIYPKQKVAIVGRSGCGKTTLAKLLVGLLKPTSGRISYDNFDQGFMSLKALREQIGYLPQSNNLFAGSIKSNITLSSDWINHEKLKKVTELANAQDFIAKFPTSFDQYLAEGGLGLSGGEKQRLALARLLYHDPKIIVMDESTSALDADSESAVLETIENHLNDKTIIIIAHRLSTIKNADLILVMDEGRIIESGTHNDLISSNSFYMQLFENQISIGDSL